MDVTKTQQISSRPIEKVIVHPLVLLSIVDNYNRVAKDSRKRVVGVLLGTSFKGTVDVTNSYAGRVYTSSYWSTISTLANEVTGKLTALKGLDARLQEIRAYLDLVIDEKIPLNHEILYHLQDVFNLLPNLNVTHILRYNAVKRNDMMLVIYLSSLIRSVIVLHNLINNQMLNKEHEKAQRLSKLPVEAEYHLGFQPMTIARACGATEFHRSHIPVHDKASNLSRAQTGANELLTKPMLGTVKINIDGFFISATGEAAIGVVAINYHGMINCGVAKKLDGTHTDESVEVVGSTEDIRLAIENG
ncbi:26S proteasome non-ATPase regulatory subunit 7 homolog A-like [Hibiscus syriacus]|uniref:26S proteasome non-ATPase regulatory subunit 7 homolog A-like n=1 Tax=Hibiscus syriacus TaxID=106335 RepID=UPI001920C6FB|nr:26S proteasome non-ATPase regulatory subunit 7 homolog A-like [Hibiscus syriacus]